VRTVVARVAESVKENVAGDFFVDATCIDCDACRQIAPATFADAGAHSFVHAQPATEEERVRALMALVSCPTASIGTRSGQDARLAVARFPERVADGVYFNGFCSESSFGASSYFVKRAAGNVLVDSPRAIGPLVKRMEELGGVSLIFLSHQDDVADAAKLAERFSAPRVIHEADDHWGVERPLRGREPVALADDLLAIPVPGHTRGSAALLYEEFLFTGDHLWADETGRLSMGRSVCWYSWSEQVKSLERLLAYDFEWVLPGHMRRYHSKTMKQDIEDLLQRLSKK
jgi:glyoxylase-like metal-dependent hydrolase (beta-lactamase superfamily II)/ferredoxin